ncbi:hypothetical protein F1880_000261 [Penicillium rolfsii]|nr:hypothetical protein F1880_000261 [Penicillium rolfsii]
MSVLTIVQRAFPFTRPWKRRSSTDKGKDKEIDVEIYTSDRDSHEQIHFGTHDANAFPGTSLSSKSLQRDVSHTLHIAVKPSPDHTTRPEDSLSESSETDSDSESQFDDDIRRPSQSGASSSSREARLARVVSWASIVRSRRRWTNEQEKQLLMAEKQLARCQKAWSSEQELWLAYIQTLSEEKAAHEGFMLMRTRQQEEERNQFRKAWKRRRSLESAMTTKAESDAMTRSDATNRFIKLPRLQWPGQFAPVLATAESTVVACHG